MKRERVIWMPKVTATFFETEGISIAICDFMRGTGGLVWAGWLGNAVKIRIQGVPSAFYKIGMDRLVESTVQAQATLVLVETASVSSPLPSPHSEIVWGTILRAPRLTKRLLISLPYGAYIVSCNAPDGFSVFAERLRKNRVSAWLRAKSVGAAGRRCYVAWSEAHFDEERLLWVKPFA